MLATEETIEPKELGAPFVVFAGWGDVPHLTEEMKREFLKMIPPNMIPARTRGVPYLGAGAIYPIPLEHILEDSFPIPDHWPRVFALDVGWKLTAALWLAWDRESDVVHAYSEHYAGQIEPLIHAQTILGSGLGNLRAKWIPGVIDPRARGRNEKDGLRIINVYKDQGLNLEIANNAVEGGIYEVWQRLSTGRLKIFRHLTNFQKEYCLYRRKEDGKIVKKHDHLLDCFAGHTRVVTNQGSIPIANLVGTSGLVLGPSGWNHYSACRLYRRQSPVVCVEFEDGRSVTCTPDHLFMTTNGWVKAEMLAGAMCCDVLSQAVCQTYQSERSLEPASSLPDEDIISAESIFSEMAIGFTGLCGKHFTEELCLAGTPFTIKTWTEQTISRPILNLLNDLSIHRFTRRAISDRYRLWPINGLRNGTGRAKEWNGIGPTIRLIFKNFIRGMLRSPAISAGLHSRQLGLAKLSLGSVPTRARQSGGDWQALMPKSDPACSALRSSGCAPSTKNTNSAHVGAVACIRVRDAGRTDTYCLTAEPDSAFAVEDGIIVHNCLRYGLLSGLARAKAVPSKGASTPVNTGFISQNAWMSS